MASNAVIPQEHADYLVSNPSLAVRRSFDQQYGEGRADQVIREAKAKSAPQDDGMLPVLEDLAGGAIEAPQQVAEGLVQGGVINPARLLQQNFGDVQFDAPVTLFNEEGAFDPKWTGFNFQSMTSDEFQERSAAGERTELDEFTTSTPDTFTGSAIREVSKFVGGYAGLGKFFRLGKGIAGTATAGAATDFLAFEGNEGRMVDALEDMGVSIPLVTSWLRTEEDDHEIVGRLKNAVEGAGVGFAFDGVMTALRGLKALRQGDKAGAEMVEEGLQEIEGAAREVEQAKITEEAGEEQASVVSQMEEVRTISDKLPANLATATPRYGYGQNNFSVKFTSDIDKALYITSQNRKSKRDADYREWLKSLGFTDFDIQSGGRKVKAALKELARKGGDQDLMQLSLPQQVGLKPGVAAQVAKSTGEADGSAVTPEFRVKMTPQQADDIRTAAILRSNQTLARRPDVNVNLERVEADTDVIDLIASQRDVLADKFNEIRGGDVQTWGQVSKRADVLAREMARMAGEDPAAFAKRLSTGFDNPVDMAAELHARWNVLMTVEEDIKVLARQVEDGVGGPQKELELLQRMEIGSNMLAEVQGLTTNVARAMNALRMMRRGDDAIRQMMQKNFTEGFGADAKAAARAVNEARKAGKSSGMAIKIAKAAAEKSRRFWDDVNTYRINAMLSGPGTQEVNFVSNAVNMVLLPFEQALGGRPLHAARTFQGMLYGAKESLHTALRTMWNEEAYLDPFSTKIEGEHSGRLATSKTAAAKIVRMPSRFMLSADEMFKQSAYRGRIFADAVHEAGVRKLKGDARKDFINQYIKGSFDEDGKAIRGDALLQAQRTTFTEGMDEKFIRDLMQLADRHPWLRLILPFIRTPVNILSQGFQHLPAAGIASGRLRRDLAAGGSRRAQAIGRQVMGTSLTVMGLYLASTGQLTGSGPKDPRARKVWLQNNRPYSFRWKDDEGNIHYWEYQRMEPLSTVLAIMADFHELSVAEETRVDVENSELLAGMLLAISENTVNKTFTQGLFDAMSVMTDPEQSGFRALNGLAGSFVPNAIPQIQDDPVFREVRNLEDEFLNRLGMDGLDPKRNILGEVVVRPGRKWDPLQLTEGDVRKPDLVMQEVERLGALFGSNFDIPRAYKINTQDIREVPFEGNKDQSLYDRRLELSGTIKIGGLTLRDRLSRLVRSKRYARMQDGASSDNKGRKYTAISKIIRRYREAADRQLTRESPSYKGIKTGLRRAIRSTRRFKTLEEAINE